MPITTASNLDVLLDFVRLKIGDTDSTAYRYVDEWLRTALVASVKILSRFWNFKYLISLDGNNNIYRNPNGYFVFDEATYGIIEQGDDQIIVIMAALIVLEGSLENSAWSISSWKDAEISFSNLEQGRIRKDIVKDLWSQLVEIIGVPQQQLAQTIKLSLPGFKDNQFEKSSEW